MNRGCVMSYLCAHGSPLWAYWCLLSLTDTCDLEQKNNMLIHLTLIFRCFKKNTTFTSKNGHLSSFQ